MAMFKAKAGASIGNVAQNKVVFAEYDIPDEMIREYRSFVETGFAAVLAKAAIIILQDMDAKKLLDAAGPTAARILD